MRRTIIAAFAAVASMSTTAYAADLGGGGSLKDAPAAYDAPAAIWAGLYVGGSAGFGVGDTSGKLMFDRYDTPVLSKATSRMDGEEIDILDFLSSDYDVNGAIYGVHVGYNFQRGNLVYGVELGLNGTDIDGSDSCVVIFKCERALDWYATAVARLGYASGKTLFYGFGGVAWGEVQTDISLLGVLPIASGEETHLGWVAGLGIEHALSDRFSVRVEYSHVDLGEEDHSLGEGLSSEVDLSFDAIKIGASYKLSGGHEALESLK